MFSRWSPRTWDTTDEAALAYARNFGSKRLYMVDPGVHTWDTAANAEVDAPASAYVAGLFAYTDAEYGYWASPSNKEFVGITGTGRPIEFLDNDPTCRANLLNEARIATIIRDGGYRLWGNRTLSADPKWSFVTRVRTLDILMDAAQAGHKWAVDRGITKTYVHDVTEGLQAFMRDQRNAGALINFEVYADPVLNTASQIEQGRVVWNVRFTDVIPAENPIFRFEVTNEWLSVRARCQPDARAGAGEDQPGPALGDGAAGRCELSGEDAADLVDLFAGAERDAEKLRYLQGRERALEGAGVCVQR